MSLTINLPDMAEFLAALGITNKGRTERGNETGSFDVKLPAPKVMAEKYSLEDDEDDEDRIDEDDFDADEDFDEDCFADEDDPWQCSACAYFCPKRNRCRLD